MAQQAVELPLEHDLVRLLEMPETRPRLFNERLHIVALGTPQGLLWERFGLFRFPSEDRSRGDSSGHNARTKERSLQRRLTIDSGKTG